VIEFELPKEFIMGVKTTPAALRPLTDRVIIRRDERISEIRGIILPDVAKKQTQKGTVLAAGPGKLNSFSGEREPLECHPGDRVLYSKYAGNDVEVDGQEYLVLKGDEIMAVLEDE
jgi:chaperonin GroES